MSKIVDLDILRPETRNVKLNGKTIDVSFVPTGATFEVDEIVRELHGITEADVKADVSKANKAFELTIRLCVAFVSHKYPEMDYDWFLNNTNGAQVKVLSEQVTQALMDSYKGVEAYSKN